MTDKIKILAISGSTRKESSNHRLIKAIADLASKNFSMHVFENLASIPSFNPDLDNTESTPEQVTDFRRQLREADGILICTPEYAIGVPGVLKNAIDWTVSSMEFSQKPVALITAGTSGKIAHQSLLGTLLIIESKITEETQLLIPFVKTKLNAECKITDEETLNNVNRLIQSLKLMITEPASLKYLPAPILMND